jgi:HK97 family phage portal protein
MRYTAVQACVRVLAETIADLPMPVYKRLKPRGKQRITHPVGELLQLRPNPYMTAFTFRELLVTHLALWGNCYAEIETNERGETVGLWPIPPWRIEHMETQDGAPYFRVTAEKTGIQRNLPYYAVLHIPGLGFDGKKGISVIAWARQALELGLAAEQFGVEFFENGMNTGAIVTHPETLSPEAFERLRKSLTENYEGLGKSHRMMLLEEGMSFAKNTIPPNDAQFLETRKFQILEIARIFRVPPHMLGDLERATFSNIEQQSIDFLTYTIQPWLSRIEQAMNYQLFTVLERKRIYVEHLIEGKLRGDSAARAAFYTAMFNIGVYSQNDIREKENENPIEGGDRYLVPLNMVPVDLLDKYYEKQLAPTPAPVVQAPPEENTDGEDTKEGGDEDVTEE